ncbi:uncharacterized protein FFUJ_14545 [Fusarium fujikuroi IMI 58289]|uniref:Uncharacterized protein n=1 Tax=Gibberella fujikuroi (strain CBS 195.34 / IMI 58289 / NRRL A-6831) TaxID=1279085 RepID=S0E5F7_GIBF5|nr:uncharacterized protein FFUJ_14545 [Fusarium fujikuroi IMI 58289]CCT67838.1 uncharacterized protein FFUJ_14545 [Fusarium fujikuroi IMI 58289]SCO21542.1 uncharacterized protein FFM5_12675 [Fusarium fujikuroi]SCO41831.1 uncharacterized protein FFMR_06544 [Fusarium fujikuroi]
MEDLNDDSKSIKLVDAMLPGFIGTIFSTSNRNLRSMKTILDKEGIVVDKLENSPYIPENVTGKLWDILAPKKPSQSSRNHKSHANQDPKVPEVNDQDDDLSEQLGSLSL